MPLKDYFLVCIVLNFQPINFGEGGYRRGTFLVCSKCQRTEHAILIIKVPVVFKFRYNQTTAFLPLNFVYHFPCRCSHFTPSLNVWQMRNLAAK